MSKFSGKNHALDMKHDIYGAVKKYILVQKNDNLNIAAEIFHLVNANPCNGPLWWL